MKKELKKFYMEVMYRGKRLYRLLSYKKGRKLMKGNDVLQVQKELNKKGYKCSMDSYYGPQTAGAVRNFQREYCIREDGIVGKQTWDTLFG